MLIDFREVIWYAYNINKMDMTRNHLFRIFCCFGLFIIIIYLNGCQQPQVKQEIKALPKKYWEPEIPVRLLPDISAQLSSYNNIRRWKYIVIHHSATSSGNAEKFDKMHRQRGWESGLGYDFVIGNGNGSNNGEIEIGTRWIKQIDGAHAGSKEYNKYGIGICLVGNFQEERPTYSQITSLIALINYLQDRYRIPSENIILHRHIKNTECPGEKFPFFEVLSNIRAY